MVCLLLAALFSVPLTVHAQVLGDPVDVSQDFQKLENVYFIGSASRRLIRQPGEGICNRIDI
jgi:hypothetical protein